MKNNQVIEVTNVIGSVGDYSLINISQNLFDLTHQSSFATRNKEKALLAFSNRKDVNGNWVKVFNLNGVELLIGTEKVADKEDAEKEINRSFFYVKTIDIPEVLFVENPVELDMSSFAELKK